MAIEIKVPPLGESLVDAVVGQWLKSEGDAISRGETILELETDKVNLDVTAEDDGVLGAIQKEEGDTVTVGEVLGVIEAGGGNGAGAPAEAEAEEPAEVEAASTAPATEPQPEPAPAAAATEEAPEPSAAEDGAGRAAPAVRRMAEEHAIDLAKVSGTGAGGRITRDDIVAYLASQRGQGGAAAPVAAPPQPETAQPTPAPAPAEQREDEERIRLSRRRQTIAKRLVEAQQTAAMLTTFNEVDMSAVMDLRKRRKESFKEQHGVNLGFMSFFTKAAVGALKAFPEVNSELQGDELILKKHYDIGIAVGVEEGLVVPVVRNADRRSFADIEREIIELAGKARENKLAISELQGGTFTITNGGVFGSLLSTPILNTPQVGILGMHTIQQRPVAVDGEVVIRPMMYVALSYDHRIVDGQQAVQFLVKIKQMVEDPETLLLEG
ncbi:MAG TPA: 2-oxoglutarate dehydrogenase complex dihydrolipoyllysine-residue succinyltransferase [Thermomicrobiales bacterium]|nr:2-oxoglutarate dehydrogenase complex dihydrolipoyllysine-residue succinyltransferase [Thermomicrobiales bacterium]